MSNSWGTGLPYGYTNKKENAWAWVKNSFLVNSLSAFSQGPGRYNNPGELLVGKSVLSPDEEATQFALWAISKAPLLFSANINDMPYSS